MFNKIRVILHPNSRQPIIPAKGSGLNSTGQPKQPAVSVVNPLARSLNFFGRNAKR